jgi:GT2 family glycosyltransferase
VKASDASVIIPAYGPAHLVEACLEALGRCEEPREVLIWDNGCSRPFKFPMRWQVLGNGDNLGFGIGCNRAAAVAVGDPLVFLNCDTEPEPGWLHALCAGLNQLAVGIVGARLHRPDGTLQHAGTELYVSPHFIQPLEVSEELPSRDVNAVSGACMAVARDCWEELGGFDEGYLNGNEDVDLCIRAARAHYTIRYVREARVMHHESATGPERWAHLQENIDRLQKKWVTA